MYFIFERKMVAAEAIRAIACTHRNILGQQLTNSPNTAAALLGEVPEGGCEAQMILNGDTATGSQTLEIRIPDANTGLRVTYETVDYTASVNYTGNGPEGKSVIGVDAILAALEFVSSKENGLAAILESGITGGRRQSSLENELDLTQLVKRCLVALREHAEKPPAK